MKPTDTVEGVTSFICVPQQLLSQLTLNPLDLLQSQESDRHWRAVESMLRNFLLEGRPACVDERVVAAEVG